MKLPEYIEQQGDHVAAEQFKVKPRTVASWRRGERSPRTKQAAIIVKVTRGLVSWADIYI